MEITKELKKEVLEYWRDTKKDKEAIARTADLFGLREEEVTRIIAVRWTEKPKFWNEDRIFRLKAYMAQGMKNMEIAKQLGCKPQAVADFKRRNKEMLAAFAGKEDKTADSTEISIEPEREETETNTVCAESEKKEPSPAATDESPKEEIEITKVNTSETDYITRLEKCQAENDKLYNDIFMVSGAADDILLLLGDLVSYFDFKAIYYQKNPKEADVFFKYNYDTLAAKVRTLHNTMKAFCFDLEELL